MGEITEINLVKAEEAIELLAAALDVTTKEVVEYIEHGFTMTAPGCKLSDKQKHFLEEMKATFDCY